MKNLLQSIKSGSSVFSVETTADGWVIEPKAWQEVAFTQMIDDLTFGQNEEFVVLPVSDGRCGYTRAVICPLSEANDRRFAVSSAS